MDPARDDAVPAPRERVTLRYVPAFRCLAGDCKENCCSGLRVELNEANYRNLVTSAAGTRLEAPVERYLQLESPATRTARVHAVIDAGGAACPFLDPGWLCSIHGQLGEAALADPCSLFPRVFTQVHGRVELSATLACPEAARLCLTTPNAVELVPLAPGTAGREIVVRRHAPEQADPYLAMLDDIRQVCLEVMSSELLDPPQRLLLLVDLADRIEPFFHAGTTSFELAALRTHVDALSSRAAVIGALWAGVPASDPAAVHALGHMLIARLPGCDNPRFNAQVRPVVLREQAAPATELSAYLAGGSGQAIADAATIVARLREAHARLSPAQHAQLDEYARRYAINSIIKDWYTQQPTLGSSLRRLIIRLALSRFLTLLHPDDGAADPLAAAAVDAFQVIAKNVEHAPAFVELYGRFLAAQGLGGVEGLARLLKV